MKKKFAAFAASAVAVSMLAFAGCGATADNGAGTIPGNYKEKSPEELATIVNDIDTDKIFGDSTALNLGVKTDLSASMDLAGMSSTSFSLGLDYKMSVSETGIGGQGSVNMKNSQTSGGQSTNSEFEGTVYHGGDFVYAASGEDKIKINMSELIAAFAPGGNDEIITPTSFYEAQDAVSVAEVLALMQQFGVKITVDDSKGVKFKMSVTEDTIWKIAGTEGGDIADQIAQLKESITFNKFKFDLYFALDENGAFSAASFVTDIDVSMPMPAGGSPMAEAAAPALSIKVKGYAEIYMHNDAVTVPDTVTGDASYVDMTDALIEMIKGMI